MGSEQGWEPLPIGQGRTGGSVTDRDEVPLTRSLGQGGADRGAARDNDHLLVLLLVNQFIQSVGPQAAITL